MRTTTLFIDGDQSGESPRMPGSSETVKRTIIESASVARLNLILAEKLILRNLVSHMNWRFDRCICKKNVINYQSFIIIFITLCVHRLTKLLSVYKQTAVAIAVGYINNVQHFNNTLGNVASQLIELVIVSSILIIDQFVTMYQQQILSKRNVTEISCQPFLCFMIVVYCS